MSAIHASIGLRTFRVTGWSGSKNQLPRPEEPLPWRVDETQHSEQYRPASKRDDTDTMTTVTVIPGEEVRIHMERKTITVTGMSCSGCEQNVETTLQNLDSVSRVDADHEADSVDVVLEDGVADDDVNAAIEQAGYDVVA